MMRSVLMTLVLPIVLWGQAPRDADLLAAPEWREVGPAAFGGRIVDLAVHPKDDATIWAASASGGLWKTTNRGTTWTPQFQSENGISIGDVAVAPTDPERLYLGTGEANNQRSSYWGDGVYRSDDGGKSWRHLGLKESHHIGRIAVHPGDADTFFVAALGHLYTPNPERGLYRSRDGGLSFDLVLAVNEDVGVVDVLIDPIDPGRVYATTYERRRRAWNFDPCGPGSGIWRSLDGGTTWERLAGGLPDGEIGRIGLALHAGDPGTLFACVENQNERGEVPEASPEDADESEEEDDRPDGLAPGVVRPVGGEVWASEDGGDTWQRRNKARVGGSPGYYYGQIRVDPNNVDRLWILGVQLFHSRDGGKTWRPDGARGTHVDHHALWVHPDHEGQLVLGNDGGLALSFDDGRTWDVPENLPLAQFYTVTVDDREPYRIYGGTQDNGTWMIPSRGRRSGGITDTECAKIYGGDGFVVAFDGDDPNIVYAESQFGGLGRVDLRTGARRRIKPTAAPGEAELRFNWMSPLVRSVHDARTLYFGSQFLHRSRTRGDDWERISPDLSTRDAAKIAGNVPHCTLTVIAESPLRAKVLWVGTDDGKLWVTRDGGRGWDDLTGRLPEEARGYWISDIAASHHEHGKAYVSLTGYREDVFDAILLVTDDYGGTFRRLDRDLPQAPINTVLEDPTHAGLLFVGHERGAAASLDGGENWTPLGAGLPRVAVHDLALQGRDGELVAATHGRGMWVIDVRALRDLTPERRRLGHWVGEARVVPRPGRTWSPGYGQSSRAFVGEHARAGIHFHYWLKEEQDERVVIEIFNAEGTRVRRLRGESSAGLHRMIYDARGQANRRLQRSRQRAPTIPAGAYVAVFTFGEEQLRRPFIMPPSNPPAAEGEVEAGAEERGAARDF